MKPHLTHPRSTYTARHAGGAFGTATDAATQTAPQVLISLPDLRAARPIPLTAPIQSRPEVAPTVRAAEAHASPAPTITRARIAPRIARRASQRTRRIRVDAINRTFGPALSNVGEMVQHAFNRDTIMAVLQGRAVWAMAIAALSMCVGGVMMGGNPSTTAPAATPTLADTLPRMPTFPTLAAPALQPSLGPAFGAPKAAKEPVFPSDSPRLGDPGEPLPWESWTPRQAPTPADSNESASNRPARLPMPLEPMAPFDNPLDDELQHESVPAAHDQPEYRTARVPSIAAPMTPNGASDEPGKARLLGIIRKPLPGVSDERARPGLY